MIVNHDERKNGDAERALAAASEVALDSSHAELVDVEKELP